MALANAELTRDAAKTRRGVGGLEATPYSPDQLRAITTQAAKALQPNMVTTEPVRSARTRQLGQPSGARPRPSGSPAHAAGGAAGAAGEQPQTPPAAEPTSYGQQPQQTVAQQAAQAYQAAYQPFGPGNDLRSTAVMPTFEPSFEDEAADLIQNADPSTAGTEQVRSAAIQAILSAMQGTDRGEAMRLRYEDLLEQSADARATGIRDIGRASAKFGRMGSGMTTNDLGTLEQRIQEADADARRDLAIETADQELSDRMALAGLGLQGSSALQGLDLARGEFDIGRASALTGLDNTRFQRGAAMRDEVRGERQFQQDQADRALDRTVQQAQLEEMLKSGQFGRDIDVIRTMLAAEASADPLAAMQAAAQQFAAAGNNSAAAQLFEMIAQRRAAGGTSS